VVWVALRERERCWRPHLRSILRMYISKRNASQAAARVLRRRRGILFAVLSINTSAGPKEILTLRLKDVDLENKS